MRSAPPTVDTQHPLSADTETRPPTVAVDVPVLAPVLADESGAAILGHGAVADGTSGDAQLGESGHQTPVAPEQIGQAQDILATTSPTRPQEGQEPSDVSAETAQDAVDTIRAMAGVPDLVDTADGLAMANSAEGAGDTAPAPTQTLADTPTDDGNGGAATPDGMATLAHDTGQGGTQAAPHPAAEEAAAPAHPPGQKPLGRAHKEAAHPLDTPEGWAPPPKPDLGQGLFAKANWAEIEGGWLLPNAFDELHEKRREGWTTVPWAAIPYWDFDTSPDPVRSLKEDWKALWMGHVHGESLPADDPKVLQEARRVDPSWTPRPDDKAALALTETGACVGLAILRPLRGVWRDRVWWAQDHEAARVALAMALRMARDAKAIIALAQPPQALSRNRGAEWGWEWIAARGGSKLWGKAAQTALEMAAKKDRARCGVVDREAGQMGM